MRGGARVASATGLSIAEQQGESIARLLHAVTAVSGQWILAADVHAQNGIAPIQTVAGLAFSPSRGLFSAQLDEATHHLGQIVIDLIGSITERADIDNAK